MITLLFGIMTANWRCYETAVSALLLRYKGSLETNVATLLTCFTAVSYLRVS